MKLIRFLNYDDAAPVFINIDLIKCVEEGSGPNSTYIFLSIPDDYVHVISTLSSVVDRIVKASECQ